MTGEFSSTWLGLREPADAAARSGDLVARLRLEPPIVIRDLGCGTGSLGRWLAPQLAGPQHWILEDRDPVLLEHAAATMARTAADGSPVTVETRRGDVTALTAADLAGTSLVTCSALLDLLTTGEVAGIAAALAASRTAALLTLSVVGEVAFDPPDDLDAAVTAAFNDHQRRTVAGRRLLGPDAPEAAAAILAEHGATVTARPSPWRLGPDRSALAAQWLRGWAAAAAEQRPDLPIDDYLARRLTGVESGQSTVTVGHQDLFAEFPLNPSPAIGV
jgi:SAM-dependent methyltransferase